MNRSIHAGVRQPKLSAHWEVTARGKEYRPASVLSTQYFCFLRESDLAHFGGMALRVLICPDKFKGTLSARAAAGAIANGWWSTRPQDEVECIPMSDGGDGFGEILSELMGAEERLVSTVDAANRPREARWWWQAETRTAVIESAEIIGLALLPAGKFHPFNLDSRGLAPVLRAAWAAGAAHVIVGIGGSATNDGGFGMARDLGWIFLGQDRQPIERWIRLDQLAGWQAAGDLPASVGLTVAVDVENPLLGLQGCTRIYGPQKGIRREQVPVAEECLEKLARLAREELGTDFAHEPGAGAGGGLGFGFRVFTGARMESGFALFSRHSGFVRKIEEADLVLTGEGMMDRQTWMGKGTGQVARMCREQGKRCVGLGGSIEGATLEVGGERLFHSLHGIAPDLTNSGQAKAEAAKWLEILARKVAAEADW